MKSFAQQAALKNKGVRICFEPIIFNQQQEVNEATQHQIPLLIKAVNRAFNSSNHFNQNNMGKLAEIKTKETNSSVEDFINSVDNEQKRKDSFVLINLMQKLTKDHPKIWGTSIIGFGNLRYKSPSSGREVDWFKIGFSPRKANLSIYLCGDVKAQADALQKLGKHKTGGGCIYINKLADIDIEVLEEMLTTALSTKQ